jgi:hypothetical protein
MMRIIDRFFRGLVITAVVVLALLLLLLLVLVTGH